MEEDDTMSTPLKGTQLDEAGVRRATDALKQRSPFNERDAAQVAIRAYLTEPPPKWPSDESVRSILHYTAGYRATRDWTADESREMLRAALLHDPIIQRAVDYARGVTAASGEGRLLIEAVREAGLLNA